MADARLPLCLNYLFKLKAHHYLTRSRYHNSNGIPKSNFHTPLEQEFSKKNLKNMLQLRIDYLTVSNAL